MMVLVLGDRRGDPDDTGCASWVKVNLPNTRRVDDRTCVAAQLGETPFPGSVVDTFVAEVSTAIPDRHGVEPLITLPVVGSDARAQRVVVDSVAHTTGKAVPTAC